MGTQSRPSITQTARAITAIQQARLSRALAAREATAEACTELVLLQGWSQEDDDKALTAQATALWAALNRRIEQLQKETE